MHQMAYGRDKHDDYYDEHGAGRRDEAQALRTSSTASATSVELEKRGDAADRLAALRERLAELEAATDEQTTVDEGRLMEALLLGIYSFFVWLIFIKLKWLPWNTVSQVTVVIIPIVGLTALILLLNVYAPSSSDVRVIKYVVQIVPQVRGQVTRGAGRGQPAGQEGRRAVQDRSDAVPARGRHARGAARRHRGLA